MKMNPILFMFAFTLLLLASCEKDPIPPDPSTIIMPPLTHQGINTFGCYIDGELFVANRGSSFWDIPPLSGSFNEGTRQFNFQGSRYSDSDPDTSDYIQMRVIVSNGLNTYDFQYNEDGKTSGYSGWYADKCNYYYREYPGFDMGKMTITHLDEEKNIISGTFYINLVNENCTEGDTIMHITDGRFDYRY